jgi:RHS repeat-associated protein
LARTTPTSSIYYTQDGNGNVTAITSSSGAVQERYTYDVYGTPTIKNASGTVLSSSAVGNRFLFTGREYIAQIGLYDYRNRAYSPGLGRFLQTDPIRFDAGDINIYRYCGNDPGNGRDPMGLCPVPWSKDQLDQLENTLNSIGQAVSNSVSSLGNAVANTSLDVIGAAEAVAIGVGVAAAADFAVPAALGYAVANPQQVVNAADLVVGVRDPNMPSGDASKASMIGSALGNLIK